MDDIMGVQNLYGSNPNFRYSPSMESDISSGYRPGRGRWVKWVSLLGLLVGSFNLFFSLHKIKHEYGSND